MHSHVFFVLWQSACSGTGYLTWWRFARLYLFWLPMKECIVGASNSTYKYCQVEIWASSNSCSPYASFVWAMKYYMLLSYIIYVRRRTSKYVTSHHLSHGATTLTNNGNWSRIGTVWLFTLFKVMSEDLAERKEEVLRYLCSSLASWKFAWTKQSYLKTSFSFSANSLLFFSTSWKQCWSGNFLLSLCWILLSLFLHQAGLVLRQQAFKRNKKERNSREGRENRQIQVTSVWRRVVNNL